MSIRSTLICRLVNRCFTAMPLRRAVGPPVLGQREGPLAYAEWEYAAAGESLRGFRPYHDIQGKRILDVGCGLGGKSTWYALNGAQAVTAVDLDPERVERAAGYAARKKAANVRFLVRDADRLEGLEDRRFQMVLFNDSFEHLQRPAAALAESFRVLEPGGTVQIVFPPYGSPWGAHLFAYVGIPWAQHLFADEPLLRIWKEGFRADAGDDGGMITPRRLREVEAARAVSELRQLNGMTISRFFDLVEASPLTPLLVRERTPRWVFPRPRRNRFLREHLVTRVTAVLKR